MSDRPHTDPPLTEILGVGIPITVDDLLDWLYQHGCGAGSGTTLTSKGRKPFVWVRRLTPDEDFNRQFDEDTLFAGYEAAVRAVHRRVS